jgi:hypothetical protein
MTQTLKAGTRIELHGTPAFGGFPGVAPEQATIARWTTVCGPLKNHVSPRCHRKSNDDRTAERTGSERESSLVRDRA